jgi:DNA replication licensing factor MCM3
MSVNESMLTNTVFTGNKRLFRDFLSSNSDFTQALQELISNKSPRFELSLSAIDQFKPGLADLITDKPQLYLPAFDEALLEAILNEQPEYLTSLDRETMESQVTSRGASTTVNSQSNSTGTSPSSVSYQTSTPHIAITDVVGRHHMTPRGLTSAMINKLVAVEGIVSRTSLVKPKARVSVFYNPVSGDMRVREHKDPGSLTTDLINNMGGVPKVDDQGNPFTAEYGYSLYHDFQKVTIQEMPESTPTGQLPRSVDILLSNDLVNSIKPGDRVKVTGVYKAAPSTTNGVTSGVFRFVLVASSMTRLQAGQSMNALFTATDIKNFKAIGARSDTFELLSGSFAPSISGRTYEKQGLLLQTFGGVEKTLPNGTHLRGDINILLIGDPSCGKSQLLRFVMNLVPLSVSTTGRGSSGVGLTAAVVMDRESGERTLEAGAMVLADRGVVCIDEFDKMSVGDRVAIHEVMEQQTVTIAKASIHASLNARCSVVAAANPIYGNFDDTLDLAKNVNLPDSLLSRFDLVFVVRDLMGEAEDRRVSGQVLKQMRSAESAGVRATNNNVTLEPRANPLEEGTTEVFRRDVDLLTLNFLKKYIAYAKARYSPVLSEESIEAISDIYVSLRETSSQSQLAVTTRTLEALIRLSTSHAKLKLRNEVLVEDVEVARSLMFAARGDAGAKANQDVEEMEIDENRPPSAATGNQRKRNKPVNQNTVPRQIPHRVPIVETPAISEDEDEDANKRTRMGQVNEPVRVLDPERMSKLKEFISESFSHHRTTFLELASLQEFVVDASGRASSLFTTEEIAQGIKSLEDEGKIYVVADVVYLL